MVVYAWAKHALLYWQPRQIATLTAQRRKPMRIHRTHLLGLLLSLILSLNTTAISANPEFGKETLIVRLGGYFSDFDTNVRLSGPNGGDKVNLEDILGLDSDQIVFRGGLAWRFAPRHRLVLDYVDFRRESTGTAEKSFTVDTEDETYEFAAGASVETNFDWRVVPITYSYAFYKTSDLELAGSAGIHWFKTNIGFAGEANVTPPGGSPSFVASAAESASGPLPVFGLQAGYALSKDWLLGTKIGWFGLDYDDYSGELWDLGVSTEYWFNENFGVGLGYSHYSIDIAVDNGEFETAVDYTYDGLNVYITIRY
jgi:hypothetical protein